MNYHTKNLQTYFLTTTIEKVLVICLNQRLSFAVISDTHPKKPTPLHCPSSRMESTTTPSPWAITVRTTRQCRTDTRTKWSQQWVHQSHMFATTQQFFMLCISLYVYHRRKGSRIISLYCTPLKLACMYSMITAALIPLVNSALK